MTDVDYQGETYYTIRNLSLYECQGWCREEVECQAASFSFVANGLGQQETVCLLQNGTQANNPTSKPIRARNQYYMVKMSIRSGELQKNLISYILTFIFSTCCQSLRLLVIWCTKIKMRLFKRNTFNFGYATLVETQTKNIPWFEFFAGNSRNFLPHFKLALSPKSQK